MVAGPLSVPLGLHAGYTDLKIWLFARSEEGKKYKKIHVRKLGKSFHITNCTTFLQFLNVNIDKN
jgi:hypothetical protein